MLLPPIIARERSLCPSARRATTRTRRMTHAWALSSVRRTRAARLTVDLPSPTTNKACSLATKWSVRTFHTPISTVSVAIHLSRVRITRLSNFSISTVSPVLCRHRISRSPCFLCLNNAVNGSSITIQRGPALTKHRLRPRPEAISKLRGSTWPTGCPLLTKVLNTNF